MKKIRSNIKDKIEPYNTRIHHKIRKAFPMRFYYISDNILSQAFDGHCYVYAFNLKNIYEL